MATDTPTPAPLTDEQIDVHLRAIRECYDGDADAVIAAVIARAKRDAAEKIAWRIDTGADVLVAFDAYWRGHIDGMKIAAAISKGTTNATD